MDATVIVALIGAGAGGLGGAGAGFKWVWNKIEARFVKIEAALAKCEHREQVAILRSARKLTCIELLWGEVVRLSPGDARANPVLQRAERIIEELSKSSPLNHPVEDFASNVKVEQP